MRTNVVNTIGMVLGVMAVSALRPTLAHAQVTCSNNVQIGLCKAGCAGNCGAPCIACPLGCAVARTTCRVACGFPGTIACRTACDATFNTCTAGCTSQCNTCTGSCSVGCDDLCVVCNAGGPYRAECEGPTTTIPLDGSASSDPQGGELTYEWTVLCPDHSTSLDDDTAVSPMLTVDTSPSCLLGCIVGLTVRDEDGGVGICGSVVDIDDTEKPMAHCPGPIALDRGDKICNGDVDRWLGSFLAEDNCTPAGEIYTWTDAPKCGFPAGTTTTVTFYAKDECGNIGSCTSDITIAPLQRVSSDQKGSMLVFSKVEIRWDAAGNLIQDTILDVSNEAEANSVNVQAYFINGDIQTEEETDQTGNVVQTFEPGWNTADCRFQLTQRQPHFWSAAKGSTKCQPFSVLDMDGPGRIDEKANDGSRMLRGFFVMWAVGFQTPDVAGAEPNGYWNEIRWNDLKGDALIINYAEGSAWEYNAWAYQNTCVGQGEVILDCTKHNHDGVCCEAEPIPGVLPVDGFSYDVNFDTLLLDFYASGSTGFSQPGVSVMVDTELVLHSMDIDVRQDGDGPVLTKVEAEIFNQNESKFSGTRRCTCCWDGTDLSAYVRDASLPNHFLRTKLGTNKGSARLDGVDSDECNYEEICAVDDMRRPIRGFKPCVGRMPGTPLSGVAVKELTFTGTIEKIERAGSNLVGVGQESSVIRYDSQTGTGELHGGGE